MSDDGHHWTYAEWKRHTIEKIVMLGLSAPEEHRADWFRVQIGIAISQAYGHGLAGAGEDDPVTP